MSIKVTTLSGTPTLPEFEAQASGKNIVAVAGALAFDHETAIGLAQRFKEEDAFFLLESATEGPRHLARFSFVGFGVTDFHELHRDGSLRCFDGQKPIASNPIIQVRDGMARFDFGFVSAKDYNWRDINPAQLVGAVGFYSYDIATDIEPTIGARLSAPLKLPLVRFVVPAVFMILDQLRRQLVVVSIHKIGSEALEDLYDAAMGRLSGVCARILAPHKTAPLKTLPFKEREPDAESVEKQRFLAMAHQCREQIRAGEIFQIQIGNRKSYRTDADPFDIFRNLRMLNPSPYMFYYRFQEDHILGASPEMMVSVSGSSLIERPIAGTRKRTWREERDRELVKELQDSEKERAEHVMLVDLCRNDIGRIAKPGTVTVDELMVVEEYSHVFHLVSQVRGIIRDDVDAFEALSASFPNGTVSGAPKVRAMQIINELEPCGREFYAGCLGIHTFGGDLRSTIIIRAIHYSNKIASTQASAGIVWDSIPEEEWLETRNKMAATVQAILTTAAEGS